MLTGHFEKNQKSHIFILIIFLPKIVTIGNTLFNKDYLKNYLEKITFTSRNNVCCKAEFKIHLLKLIFAVLKNGKSRGVIVVIGYKNQTSQQCRIRSELDKICGRPPRGSQEGLGSHGLGVSIQSRAL